jgi:hypothetical protein
MYFNVLSTFNDEGMPCDVTTLHDWLINMDDKNVSLPMNHVAFISEPNKDTKKLYEMESVKEFDKNTYKSTIEENESTPKSKSKQNDLPNNIDTDIFGMFLEQIINQSMEKEPEPRNIPKRKRKPKKEYLPPDMTDESELDRHMIMMQLYIPAESIMNMLTSGLLDPKVLLDMIKEVKKRNKFTGDEKDRGDFGTKFTDWNPDPKSDDYN